MAKLRWSPEAYERTESIKKYIEKESPGAALEFAKGILEQIENIAAFPFIGKSAYSETYPHLRVLVWENYKIYYEFKKEDDIIEVWGVWDARSMVEVRKKYILF